MRRTSVVLAVVAAMVTVLVFAAPAFAADSPERLCTPAPKPDTMTSVRPGPEFNSMDQPAPTTIYEPGACLNIGG